jgi:hypothetical protein
MKIEDIKYRYTIYFKIETGDIRKNYETTEYIIEKCHYMNGVNDAGNGGLGSFITLEETSKDKLIKETKAIIRYIKRFKGARIE